MLSRSTRISILLFVDVIFFFIELIVGYAVGSLALVADSFHMLNDVMSLIVALYAIKLMKSEASPRYSYGWHRAEIVAALINGVFLLALCFSIFMEALERFFSTTEISNAKLIVIVGSLGLTSNMLGLLLFNEHSHSHEGSANSKPADRTLSESSPGSVPATAGTNGAANGSTSAADSNGQPDDSFTTLYGHPAATRASLVQAAQDMANGRQTSPTSNQPGRRRGDVFIDIEEGSGSDARSDNGEPTVEGVSGPKYSDQPAEVSDAGHDTRAARIGGGGHGGSNKSMNMHALILHVIGDALGNVGVISTGLVIWLSSWKYKYYFDPVISLVITCIIFSSAMPLVRSASFILLQAVPSTISLEALRENIQGVSGVLSVHELHVWQLSENKIVASVHVWVSRKREYMHIAREIRKILHDHGVHSSTIQPEFHLAQDAPPEEHLITDQETHCLIPCPPDAVCDENACCPPQKPPLVDV